MFQYLFIPLLLAIYEISKLLNTGLDRYPKSSGARLEAGGCRRSVTNASPPNVFHVLLCRDTLTILISLCECGVNPEVPHNSVRRTCLLIERKNSRISARPGQRDYVPFQFSDTIHIVVGPCWCGERVDERSAVPANQLKAGVYSTSAGVGR